MKKSTPLEITPSSYDPEYDVVPHAIFWRPIDYFTTKFKNMHDDLDYFKGASFKIGNEYNFDLRTYNGHPQSTVTMYLPESIEISKTIGIITDLVISGMAVPKISVAWRRGMSFSYGELARPTNDRLREPEARLIALKIASQCKGLTATTEYIKQHATRYFHPSEFDLLPSTSRSGEQHWQQIIGNIVSHRSTSKSLFTLGYAIRADRGLTVTKAGLAYLKSIGFSN